mgnify:CR=1 FL=1
MGSNEKLPVPCAGEEWCPIQATAILLCKKWHPVILHRLMVLGPMGFNELKEEVDGISSKVLSDNLEGLGENELVERNVVSEKPFRVQYSLTDRGESLEHIIKDMRDWGEDNLMNPLPEEEAPVN